MIGADGLLPALHQGRPWRRTWPLGLSEHLGYDKGEPTTQARGNTRNGTTSKTADSSGWGPLRPVVPRDRAGTFTPRPGSTMGQRRPGRPRCV